VDSRPDPEFRFSAIERAVLEFLKVPLAPEQPEGSPQSIRVFHAGRQYYLWSILVWASVCVVVFAALATISTAAAINMPDAARWQQVFLRVLLGLAWIMFALTAFVTFVARRINYCLRWYIVTDRSLRIRSGVFSVGELTMTYSNIQEIRVTSGPLQYLLGLADVEVQAAGGGGGSEKHRRGGHTGRFEGLSDANEIRDLLVDRVRRYRDSGLGETPAQPVVTDRSEIAAAKAVLDEVRALRAAVLTD
jgi:membrane protein YdbS with pleckstrin-like domain